MSRSLSLSIYIYIYICTHTPIYTYTSGLWPGIAPEARPNRKNYIYIYICNYRRVYIYIYIYIYLFMQLHIVLELAGTARALPRQHILLQRASGRSWDTCQGGVLAEWIQCVNYGVDFDFIFLDCFCWGRGREGTFKWLAASSVAFMLPIVSLSLSANRPLPLILCLEGSRYKRLHRLHSVVSHIYVYCIGACIYIYIYTIYDI